MGRRSLKEYNADRLEDLIDAFKRVQDERDEAMTALLAVKTWCDLAEDGATRTELAVMVHELVEPSLRLLSGNHPSGASRPT